MCERYVTPAASGAVGARVSFSRTGHRALIRRAIKNRWIAHGAIEEHLDAGVLRG